MLEEGGRGSDGGQWSSYPGCWRKGEEGVMEGIGVGLLGARGRGKRESWRAVEGSGVGQMMYTKWE